MQPDLTLIAEIAPIAVACSEIGEDLGVPARAKHLVVIGAGVLVAALLTAAPAQHVQEILLEGLLSGLAGAGLLNLGAIVRPAKPSA